ncbi:response regulator transcription factor [Marixanthomonas ophiurae]|uniref:DNA-binding response regulator n=1 Tax=Marixanthomonas ophiurae TaxID=387659 RepID=A0A3E1Q6U1_9FLAO|nr:response regulator transcription factor [Marixanthomonas ophiurae]RFN57840.1 DNA-binding response regulator [Marixanthomonas ophiurae]
MRQILLIEDEFIIAKDIKLLLEKDTSIHVKTARNYEEAYIHFKANNIDVIICDINLNEEKDGIDIMTEFKQLKTVPVVYLTAYDSHDILKRAKQTMPFAYLLKPFNEVQLKVTIDLAYLNYQKENDSIIENSDYTEQLEELTKREKEILVVIASGKTSKETGEYLNISSHTVEKHKKNIKKKLDLNTVGELVGFAMRSNLYEVS